MSKQIIILWSFSNQADIIKVLSQSREAIFRNMTILEALFLFGVHLQKKIEK